MGVMILVAWVGKWEYLVLDNPIEVTILNLLKVFVFIDIKDGGILQGIFSIMFIGLVSELQKNLI